MLCKALSIVRGTTIGRDMKTIGSFIRFSGNVCGGLRTHESITYRTVGTSIVIASPTTEDLLVAKSGKVRIQLCDIFAEHLR